MHDWSLEIFIQRTGYPWIDVWKNPRLKVLTVLGKIFEKFTLKSLDSPRLNVLIVLGKIFEESTFKSPDFPWGNI